MFQQSAWFMVATIFAVAMTAACGSDDSSEPLPLNAEQFDKNLSICMFENGITDNPSENVAIKYQNDSLYRQVFEECVREIAPDEADMLLSVSYVAFC